MYISKKVVTALLALGVVGVIGVYLNTAPKQVEALESVINYNARYVFIGSQSQPAIFDTSSGVYRVWSPNDTKTVMTYDFAVHKVVAVDSLSFR